MSESLSLITGTKARQYKSLLPQVKALIENEPDLIANMANITAALKMQFNWLWTGFYLVKDDELVLGPFQGPVACTRIKKGRGVCGKAWQDAATLIVEDVTAFPGHIACNSFSRSEIVVPLTAQGKVIAVLDIDSDKLSDFDATDRKYLEELAGYMHVHP